MALDAGLVYEVAWAAAGVMGCWAACLAATHGVTLYNQKDGSVLKEPTLTQRFEAADIMFALPFYVLIFYLAALATYEHYGTVNSRWHGTSFASQQFQLLYVVRMLTHCPIQWLVLARDPKFRLQMTAHHLLSVVCYGCGLVTTRMHFWAVMDGLCEFSTLFLNVVFAFKSFSPKDDNRYPLAKAATGVMLWLGFVVFRLALFPVWLYWFYQDVTTHAAETWDRVGALERYFDPSVTLFLLVISIVWFIPITKGFLKAVGMAGKKIKKAD